MVTGSVTAELAHCHHLAQRLPAVVCSVEYRLSPEHVYPAAIEDGRDAALGLLKLTTIGGCDVDTGNVATAGFSAGGYMAANIARALASSGVTPTVQVSVCPMAKPFGGTASEAAQADSPIWPRAANQYSWSAFLRGQPAAAASWSANLLVDPPEQVIERLPPTYVQVMTLDTLRDEGAEYAARLADLGKLIAIDEFNTTHIGFLSGIAKGGNAEAAWPKVVAVLKRYLQPTAE
jgi:acetyl esterase/lipase